jgi:hypothetical protein
VGLAYTGRTQEHHVHRLVKERVSGHDKIPKNGHEKCTTLAN